MKITGQQSNSGGGQEKRCQLRAVGIGQDPPDTSQAEQSNGALPYTYESRVRHGNDGEVTKILYGPDSENKYITTYFRRSVTLPVVSNLDFLQLLLSRDDGAVVYLNGKEILRSNMPVKGEITYHTLAVRTHDERQFLEFEVPLELLRLGQNVIAAEVHQGTPASSDTGFDLAIQGIKQNRTIIPTGSVNLLKARAYVNGTWSPLSIYPSKSDK